ncbi:MAG TPA: hypothetical protein H9798_02395 [Candidatus Mediterraneibacter pullicola]|uniref:Uncharacterized protein n=1 Tax=Candidatus Mediterraneibacter pullicola TaxID=2838682 RepID=A0A9D2KK23_9FIRM|nr:hypothetical protein [Candidatus Mediterraneibacter pullicola]
MESINTEALAARLRKYYMENAPKGITPHDIKHMGNWDLPNINCFLHEFDDDNNF